MAGFTHSDIRGITVPIVTPLRHDGGIDRDAVHNIADHVVGKEKPYHVHGIFDSGMTGEFPWLTIEQRKDMHTETVKAVNGRVPVLFGAACRQSIGDTIALCRWAEENDADGIVIAPLYIHPSNRGMPDVMKKIAASTGLPVYLYTNPAFAEFGPRGSKRNVKTGIYKRILIGNQNVWGIKDSSGEGWRFPEYREASRHKPGATAFMGDESRMVESQNVVPSLANLDPLSFYDLYVALMENEGPTEKTAIQKWIIEAGNTVYCNHRKRIGGLKAAMNELGLCGKQTCMEDQMLSAEEEKQVREFVGKEYIGSGAYKKI